MSNSSSIFKTNTLTLNGRTVVYLTAGSGDDMVFLHGTGTFPGFDAVAELAKDHRLIIPFHPNFGLSDDDDRIVEIGDYVLHYMDLFDAMQLQNFVLGGFSLGGWIAAEFAMRQPQRLKALFLAAPAGLQIASIMQPDLSTVAPPDIPGYLSHDPAVALCYFPAGPDAAFEQALGREMGGLARIHAARSADSTDLNHWLHRLTMPTLLLWGDKDRILPPAYGEAWRAGIPDARLEYVSGSGHLLFEENPAAASRVTAFLSGLHQE